MGNLHPLRQQAVLIRRLADYPFEGRGIKLRDQKLPAGVEAQQAATILPAQRWNAAASSDPKGLSHQG